MKYTLYSVNDWLEGEEDLEVTRREYYHALYGETPDQARILDLEIPDRRRRMSPTDMIQNLAIIVIVLFVLIVVLAWPWRR
jgi:hypothetical protein